MSTVTHQNTVAATVPLGKAEAAPSHGQRRLVRLILLLTTFLVCTATLEIGLRTAGRYQFDGIDGYLAEGGISYGLAKNASKRVFWPTHAWDVHTDEHGIRANKPGPRNLDARPYWAILGSSEVFGNGLDYDDTFIGVFASKMESHQIETVNLAVPGHHFLEQMARFKEFAASAKTPPKVVAITLNPLLIGGYDVINSRAVVHHGELFDRDNWRAPLVKMILGNSSAVYCFFRDSIRNIQLQYFSRQDFSLDFYIDRYSTKLAIRDPEKTADFLSRLSELEAVVRSMGATPIYMYTPTSGEFLLDKLKAQGQLDGSRFDTDFFEDLVKEHSAAAGIPLVDFRPMVQERYDRGEKLNFDLDAHFNGPTSLAIGEYMYQSLRPVATDARQ